MSRERRKLTDEQLDAMTEALHQASQLHAKHLTELGDEAGDLVTIEEYDAAFAAVGLGFLGEYRRRLIAQKQEIQPVGGDQAHSPCIQAENPTCQSLA